MQPLISVIVPIFNTGEYLYDCLDSIARQTYKNLEVILVDDGSTDSSSKICDEYAVQDTRFRVIHKQNQGVSKARNAALQVAQGEYIGFVDSDDIIELDMYEFLYAKAIEYNAEISICGTKVIDNSGERKLTNLNELTVLNSDVAAENLLFGRVFTGSPCDKLFKKECIEEVFFPEDIYNGEDIYFVFKSILNSSKIIVAPESKYNYCKREGSASTVSFNEKMFTYHTVSERLLEIVCKTENADLIEAAHTSILTCDIWLLQKLYDEKQSKSKYCEILSRSIKKHFKFKRLKKITIFQKISIISFYFNSNIFFIVNFFVRKLKKFLGRNY